VDPFAVLDDGERSLLREQSRPDWLEPMKAVLTDERFSRDDWVFERKFDGIRCLAFKADDVVRLRSRNDLSLNGRFPEIAEALSADPITDVVLDGEVVAFAGSQTSFERLQQRGERDVKVFFYVFDVLHLAGHATTALPLRARKRLLRHLELADPIRLATHRNREGEAFYRHACEHGWEGLIAKRADAPYVHGRSRDWLKFKCSAEQELVVGGYTAPRGSRTDLGALLLGYFENGRLRYAGKVGTGFTQSTLRDLAGRLAPLRRDDSPFADEVRLKDVTWVQPELVAQIGFSEWTRDGRLRHPRFLGLRDDKAAAEVVRESATEARAGR
jgi:bifunctional non-homologous end joining protein LigD